MIGATGENASDEGGFIIDPGGGENISTSKAGKITAIINGMTQETTEVCAPGSIGAETAEEWRGGIPRGLMIDPGGGDNIYAGGGEIFYPEIKDPGGGENIDLVGGSTTDNEVHRKVYEVQENKDHRSVKEDEGDARLLAEKEKDAEAEKAKKKAKEEARKRKEEHEAIYEMICVEESELRKEGTKKEFCKLYPWARMTMQLCDLAKVICAI